MLSWDLFAICFHCSYRLTILLCSCNTLLTFPKMSWKLRYRRYENKNCVNKVHLMLTFKLLLFVRVILTLGSGVGFPHWSHNWTIMGLRNSLPLITATGWKRYKCTVLFNSTYLGYSQQFRNPQNNTFSTLFVSHNS